jgi:hypothetical protein
MNWGNTISTKYVIKYRSRPSRILLSRAKLYCRFYKREKIKFKYLKTEDAVKELKEELIKLTNNNIKVVYQDISSMMNIIPLNNILTVNPNVKFRTIDVQRLKVHEIGTHYMRYYNAKKFNVRILESGTSNYIETEEGLAAYMEEIKGVSSKAQLYIYAGRVIGTFYALKMSFYELYFLLKKYGFKDEDAFSISTRAKRNISDTSKKGGFTKDYVYFSGYYKVKKYAKKNDLKELFIGKININDRKILKKFIQENKEKIETILD